MRVHLLSLPNVQTTRDYYLDGFCGMLLRFARILKDYLGAEVILYASEENEAPCDELVTVITKEEQFALREITIVDGESKRMPWSYDRAHTAHMSPLFLLANGRILKELEKRKRSGDIICSAIGHTHKVIGESFPDLPFVEYSIGYPDSWSKYRVFESQAWRHTTYGIQNCGIGVRPYDDVIPCAYDVSEFPFGQDRERIALYAGRLIANKGIDIAYQAAVDCHMPFYMIGPMHEKATLQPGTHYLGTPPNKDRNEWLSRAQAVILPTTYLEPFNQVACEAQLCGTPVIATDWGGFTETIEHGKTGFRCRTREEFAASLDASKGLDHAYIRERAIRLYGLEAVAEQYRAYFNRITGRKSE